MLCQTKVRNDEQSGTRKPNTSSATSLRTQNSRIAEQKECLEQTDALHLHVDVEEANLQ